MGELRQRRPAPFRWELLALPVVKEARDEFKRAVFARDDRRCFLKRWHRHKCSPVLDAHHVLRVQVLYEHFRDAGLTDAEWAALLYDPDNGLTVCRFAHDQLTARHWVIHHEQLPDHVRYFADSNGIPPHKLERECPPITAER